MGAAAAAHAPHDVVTLLAVSPQFDRDGTVFAAVHLTEHALFARSDDGGRSWVQLGHAMTADGLTSFAFSPTFARDGIAFAGTARGGVYRTTDHGTTWQPVGALPPGLAVRDVATSPRDPSDPLAGWDGVAVAASASGCWATRDGGLTWEPCSDGLTEQDLTAVAFGNEPGTVFTGRRVLHASLDGGRTWTPRAQLDWPMATLDVSPAGPASSTLAVGFGAAGGAPGDGLIGGLDPGVGVWISTNGGLSFASARGQVEGRRVNDVAFADDGTLFAAPYDQGPYRASPPYDHWLLGVAGLDPAAHQSNNHYLAVAPSPRFGADRTVLLGSFEGLYASRDGGGSWEQQDVYSPRVVRGLAFSPDFADDRVVYAGSYGGGLMRFRMTDRAGARGAAGSGATVPGATAATVFGAEPSAPEDAPGTRSSGAWTALGTGLSSLYSGAFALSPDFRDDGIVFYGYLHTYRSIDRGRTWTELPQPEHQFVARALAPSPSFARDRVLFAGGASGSFRSDDGGDSWTALAPGGLPADIRASRIVCSPGWETDRTVFHASTNRGVWRSTDGGAGWFALGLDASAVRDLAVSPGFTADRTVLAGTAGDGLWRSSDGGDSWEPVSLAADAHRVVEAVAFSPDAARDGTAFVALDSGAVYRSADAGASWMPADAGLPAQAVRALAVSPDFACDRTVLLANHDWVWCSTDAGASWQRLPGYVRIDERHPLALHVGSWEPVDAPGGSDFGPGVALCAGAGDVTELTFFGDSVTWYAPRGPQQTAVAAVSIDGFPVHEIELWSETPEHQRAVFSRALRAKRWHTLRVTNTGARAASAPPGAAAVLHSDGFAFGF